MNFSDEFQDSETLLRGVHKNSDFYTLRDAFENGFISKDDLYEIGNAFPLAVYR